MPHRAAALLAATTLVTAGMGVGMATGVANAAGTCSDTSHQTKNDISTVGITHVYDKTVTADTIGVGTSATYKIVVGTTGIGNPYVNTITDFPPAGFGTPTSVTVTAYHLGQGEVTTAVTPEPNAGGWKVTSTGWFVSSSYPVTMTVTYPIPASVAAGQQITSGGVGVAGTVGVGNTMPNLTACFTARADNAGETATGSLNNNGLGSSQGQLSSTGSISDILGNAIKQAIGS